MGEASRTEAISVTVPADVLAAARELVAAKEAQSLSALISEALAARVARKRDPQRVRVYIEEHFLGGVGLTADELAEGQRMLAEVKARAASRRASAA